MSELAVADQGEAIPPAFDLPLVLGQNLRRLRTRQGYSLE